MAWLYLFSAIILEVIATIQLKFSNGFTKFYPSVLTMVFFALSFVAAAIAVRKIDLSLAYAIWSGLGTVAVFGIGIVYFGEPSNLSKFVFMGLILIGLVGLNFHS